MTSPSSRRGFLRGLTTLPLIGGGVTLIGNPTAAATPITSGLLATYSAWLHYERQLLHHVSLESDSQFVPAMNPAFRFHFPRGIDVEENGRRAQERAAIVLATVGCQPTSPVADDYWKDTFRRDWQGGEA